MRNTLSKSTVNGHAVLVQAADDNGREYGYGRYINGVVGGVIEASETLPMDAAQADIDAAAARIAKRAAHIAGNLPTNYAA